MLQQTFLNRSTPNFHSTREFGVFPVQGHLVKDRKPERTEFLRFDNFETCALSSALNLGLKSEPTHSYQLTIQHVDGFTGTFPAVWPLCRAQPF